MSKVENATTTHYVYDGGVNIQEYKRRRPGRRRLVLAKQLVRGTGMGGGIGSVLYTEDSSGNERSFFCYNAIGSVVALTNSNGTVTSTSDYEAFGKEVRTTGNSDETRKFCTKERDASIGLDNFGFRYYDADLGRFITRDPSGYPDGPNNYLYCNNNPINHIDPLGLKKQKKESGAEKRSRRAKSKARTKIDKLKHKLKNTKKKKEKESLIDKIKRSEFKYNKKYGYGSVDEVAMAALGYVSGAQNSKSIEYGGRLYYDPESKRYHFTAPTKGRGTQTYPGGIPDGTLDAGIYHTHPARPGSENFSGLDATGSYKGDIDAVTTEGALSRNYMLDTKTGKVRVFRGGIDSKYDSKGTVVGTVDAPIAPGPLPYVWNQSDIASRSAPTRRFYGKISEKGRAIYKRDATGKQQVNWKLPRDQGMKQYRNKSIYDQSTGKIKSGYYTGEKL